MEATSMEVTLAAAEVRWREGRRLMGEMASQFAHLNAGMARVLELVWELGVGGHVVDELARFVAFLLGVPTGEAREYVRVGEALRGLGRGRCELEDGLLIAPETARRLGCDAELVTQVERAGLPLSVGRRRRTVPPALRRLLEARDEETCCFPGCERRRHLQAHHRRHWAQGGETSLANLVLLCWFHHRLVHEGGYTIEDDAADGLGFRNRHGVLHPSLPPRPPPGSADALLAENERLGLLIGPETNRHGCGDPMHLDLTVWAIGSTLGHWPSGN